MSAEVVKDDEGGCFIPATQRPDGTWRKARRVKDGYIPQEEQPLYESKGKQWAKGHSDYPVGLAPELIQEAKLKKDQQQAPPPKNMGIPGLSVTPKPEKSKSQKKKGGGKKKGKSQITEITQQIQEVKIKETTGQQSTSQTDPNKRLRNLRKKLRDIEKLEEQIKSGELKKPEEEQLQKLKKKDEVLQTIKELELEIGESESN